MMESAPFSTASGFLRWSFGNPPSSRVRNFLRKYYTSYYDNAGASGLCLEVYRPTVAHADRVGKDDKPEFSKSAAG